MPSRSRYLLNFWVEGEGDDDNGVGYCVASVLHCSPLQGELVSHIATPAEMCKLNTLPWSEVCDYVSSGAGAAWPAWPELAASGPLGPEAGEQTQTNDEIGMVATLGTEVEVEVAAASGPTGPEAGQQGAADDDEEISFLRASTGGGEVAVRSNIPLPTADLQGDPFVMITSNGRRGGGAAYGSHLVG